VTDPLRRLAPVVRLAPAKLNLTLAVTGRRPDGYHELHSVMIPLALSDRLSVAISSASSDSLHVRGADTGPATDNLVLRAIAETRTAVGRGWTGASGVGPSAAPALAARLEKAIPVAAGLGGGSADAAAAMDASLEAWDAELDEARLWAIALGLGSDVPFFLRRAPAIVEGRGERVTPLPALRGESAGFLLVTPGIRVPTAEVFAAYAAGARSGDPGSTRQTSQHLADEWRAGLDAGRLFHRAGVLAPANDLLLATAAVAPDIVGARRALARLVGRPVGQSGSGPTCWVLYPSGADAAAAAHRVIQALERGELRLPGEGRPFVHATTAAPHAAQAPPAERTPIARGGVIPLDRRTASE
jgi:4-diphosphocytidyl-2-C-methyl-D-erythritol kinase